MLPFQTADTLFHRCHFSKAAVVLLLFVFSVPATRADSSFEEPPVNYGKGKLSDPVFRLQRRINNGKAKLQYDEEHGYLASVLKNLDISVSSQLLVFSKTSFQRRRISRLRPRAIYFNDDVYIGWVQNGDVVEVSSVDPQQGAIFYSLDQKKVDRPTFLRHTDRCLICHSSTMTQSVPGHLVRSVYPDLTGTPLFGAGTFRTDHSSPLKERWGGWYVSGTHGKQRHMGNVYAHDRHDPEKIDTEAGANITNLSEIVRTSPYLGSHSDIVALMVLEHQSQMHNFITAANYQARFALRDEAVLQKMLKNPDEKRLPSIQRRFAHAAQKILRYLLFCDEVKLNAQIQGTSGFAKDFSSRGPRDRKGRSLRDFDLRTRIFKYPCSYLIYSKSFDGLPQPVQESVYRQLWEILSGRNDSEDFRHLSTADRQAIREILIDTKPDLPDYFRDKP